VKCQHNLVQLRKQLNIPVATPVDGIRLFTCKEQVTKPGLKGPGFLLRATLSASPGAISLAEISLHARDVSGAMTFSKSQRNAGLHVEGGNRRAGS
jgi:hypothetical protein